MSLSNLCSAFITTCNSDRYKTRHNHTKLSITEIIQCISTTFRMFIGKRLTPFLQKQKPTPKQKQKNKNKQKQPPKITKKNNKNKKNRQHPQNNNNKNKNKTKKTQNKKKKHGIIYCRISTQNALVSQLSDWPSHQLCTLLYTPLLTHSVV